MPRKTYWCYVRVCSQGYTEALWSTYCTPVTDCNDHWFWILFLALVFSMAIILVFKPPFVTYCLKHIFWFRTNSRNADTQVNHDIIPSSFNEETPHGHISLSSTEQHKQDKRQFSRFVETIFYFYQIAQLLLSSSSLKEYLDSQLLQFPTKFYETRFSLPFSRHHSRDKIIFQNCSTLWNFDCNFPHLCLAFFHLSYEGFKSSSYCSIPPSQY